MTDKVFSYYSLIATGYEQEKAAEGKRAQGRGREKDTRLRQGYQVTNPFLGARGVSASLTCRERCEPL